MYRKTVKSKNFSDDQLLDLVRKYKSYNNMQVSRTSEEPSPRALVTRFGSWSEATRLAGVIATSGLREDRPTLLYLVKIKDYYKIGITQMNSVEARFVSHGIRDFIVIDLVKFDTLNEAKEIERDLLNLIKYNKIDHREIESFSECFNCTKELKALEDLYTEFE